MRKGATTRIGLISDTHGLLRPEAVAALRGADLIIHGGDIGGADILDALRSIAPLTAVRGNNDRGPWAESLQVTAEIAVGAVRVLAIHDLAQLDLKRRGMAVRVVVSGHSHKPLIAERDGVLFVNPGSAGPRRFNLPIALGELLIDGSAVTARLVDLPV